MLGPIFDFLDLPSLFSLAGRDICAMETCLALGEAHSPCGEAPCLGETHVLCGEAPCLCENQKKHGYPHCFLQTIMGKPVKFQKKHENA